MKDLRSVMTELESENEKLRGWLNAAARMCQWIDYHGEEVEAWGPNEAAAHQKMHDAITAYEAEKSGRLAES